MPINLAVVNDYPVVVAGVRAVLEPFADRVRVTEMNVNTTVVSEVDVVLQDTFGNPYQPVPDPRSGTGLRPRLVVFTWDTDPRHVLAAIDAGADGYVPKTVTPHELLDAVERVYQGERVILCEMLGGAACGASYDAPGAGTGSSLDDEQGLSRWPGHEHGLSGRESEVLALICQGMSNVEISQRAFIGINTVKTYIRSAYRKIGVTTRPQAVIWALSHGFEPGSTYRVFPTDRQPADPSR